MSSRAALLLQREDRLLRDDPAYGVRTSFLRNNPFEWEVLLTGPEGTPWEGGIFKLFMSFDEHFDECPPATVGFVTVPFHPNIDLRTGHPHLPLLDDVEMGWQTSQAAGGGLRHLLTELRTLLAQPLVSYPPTNVSAYKCWQERPRLYEQLVRDCVLASRRLAAGLPLQEGDDDDGEEGEGSEAGKLRDQPQDTKEAEEQEDEAARRLRLKRDVMAKVNFEDYYTQWRMMATSMPTDRTSGGRLLLGRSPRLKMTVMAIEEVTQRQHDILYGRFPELPGGPSSRSATPHDPFGRLRTLTAAQKRFRAARHERVNHLRKVYNLEGKDWHGDGGAQRQQSPPIQIPTATGMADDGAGSMIPALDSNGLAMSGLPPPISQEPEQQQCDATILQQIPSILDWDLERESSRRVADTKMGFFDRNAMLPPDSRSVATATTANTKGDDQSVLDGMAPWEKEEADDLLQWSSKLDVGQVEF